MSCKPRTIPDWIGTHVGDFWNWATNQDNAMGAPYVNPSAQTLCGVTGFGFGNSSSIDCDEFESPFFMMGYSARLVTWLTTKDGAENRWLSQLFPWKGKNNGPTSHEITCYVFNIGTLFSFFLMLTLLIGLGYILWSVYSSHKNYYEKETIKDQIRQLGREIVELKGKKNV